ncbi:MAG: arylsulfatase [Puniceicoccaceae bacterium]
MRILSLFFLLASVCFASTQPNIIIILTDDQGWGDLSLHGNQTVETPNLDKFAEEGIQFDRFYVQPVCSPTRAEILTGRYSARGGVYSTSAGGERLDLDETTIAEVFRSAGYRTGVFGKWHNGSQYPYHPLGRGFDEFYGFTSGHWGLYFDPMIEHNGTYTRANGFIIDDLTDKAMSFAAENAKNEQPFFLFLTYNTPHSPMMVADPLWEKYGNRELKQKGTNAKNEDPVHTLAALALCENIDWNVGRLVDKLKSLKIDEDTIVLYMTDNGPNGDRWNEGMKGRKGSTDEGGVRSPMFMRWPGTFESGKMVMEPGAAIDLLPTLADLADIQINTDKPLDGISLKPLLTGNPGKWQDRFIFNAWRGNISVRTKRYRLDTKGNLYHMLEDPGQLKDVSKDKPKIARQLREARDKFKTEVVDGAYDENRPFLVGHADFNITHLPARDATVTGAIERSARPPNDSFFRNWISSKDTINWDVDVLESGTYSAEILYTCPEDSVGAVVELEFQGATTTATVKEPHDPPFLGRDKIRSIKSESPVKIFRKMGIGSIELEAGTGTMKLKAIDIPGSQAIDFRLLTLTRVR